MPSFDVIQDDDAMPAQPDALPRFTMSGMGLTVQGDVGGVTIAMERHVDATADEEYLNEILDVMTRAWQRQRAKSALRGMLLQVEEAKLAMKAMPLRKTQMRGERVADRARLIASFNAAWAVAGKVTPFKPNQSQAANLESHDAETKVKEAEFDKKSAEAQLAIPFFEAEIAKLRRQIAGHDPVDEGEPLAQAAE